MRIQLTKQECIWLTDLVKKEKERADEAFNEMPHRILELRRDNIADLENKLATAIQREIQKERDDAR